MFKKKPVSEQKKIVVSYPVSPDFSELLPSVRIWIPFFTSETAFPESSSLSLKSSFWSVSAQLKPASQSTRIGDFSSVDFGGETTAFPASQAVFWNYC